MSKLSLKDILNKLEHVQPNVYIVVMMVAFIAFFDAIGRILDFVLPNRGSLLSVIVSVVVVICTLVVFLAQDGKLVELSLNNEKNKRKGVIVGMTRAKN